MAPSRFRGFFHRIALVGCLLSGGTALAETAERETYDPRLDRFRPPSTIKNPNYEDEMRRVAKFTEDAARNERLAAAALRNIGLRPEEIVERAMKGACGSIAGPRETDPVKVSTRGACAEVIQPNIPGMEPPLYSEEADSQRAGGDKGPAVTENWKTFRTDATNYLGKLGTRLDPIQGMNHLYVLEQVPPHNIFKKAPLAASLAEFGTAPPAPDPNRDPDNLGLTFRAQGNFDFDEKGVGIRKATALFHIAYWGTKSLFRGQEYSTVEVAYDTGLTGAAKSGKAKLPLEAHKNNFVGIDVVAEAEFSPVPFGSQVRRLVNAYYDRLGDPKYPGIYNPKVAGGTAARRQIPRVRFALIDLLLNDLIQGAHAVPIVHHNFIPAEFANPESKTLDKMFFKESAESLGEAMRKARSFLAKDLADFNKNADAYERNKEAAKQARENADKAHKEANKQVPNPDRNKNPNKNKGDDKKDDGKGKGDGGGGGGGGGGPQAQGGGGQSQLGMGNGSIETGNAPAPSAPEQGGIVGAPNQDPFKRFGFTDPITGIRNPFAFSKAQGQQVNQPLNFAGNAKAPRAPAAVPGGAAGSPIQNNNNQGQAAAPAAGGTGTGGPVAGQPGGAPGADPGIFNVGKEDPEYRVKNDFRRFEDYQGGGGGGGGDSGASGEAVVAKAGGGGGGGGEALAFGMQIKQPRATRGQRQRRLGIMGYVGTFGETCWAKADASRNIPMAICEGRPRGFGTPGGSDAAKDAPGAPPAAAAPAAAAKDPSA